MQYKIEKTALVSLKMTLELVALNSHFYRKGILVIASQCVNKQSQDFRHYYDRHFWTLVLPEWQKICTKLLSCIFQQCLGPFNMLTVQRCTQTWLFRHLHNHVFPRLIPRKYITYEADLFFFQIFKIKCTFQKYKKKLTKRL